LTVSGIHGKMGSESEGSVCVMSKLEWDEEKNRKNQQKHGIAFETAARIFLHPYMELWDEMHSGINKELCRNYLYRMRRMNSSVQGGGGRRAGAR